MKTKNIFIITTTLCISLCWGCSKKPVEEIKIETPKISETLSDADIIIPSGLVGNELAQVQAEASPEAASDSNSGDNLDTYSLSGGERKDILYQMSDDMAASIQAILDNEDCYPNVTNITHSDDYTLFTIFLKDGQLNTYEAMLVMSFYTAGNKFQIYNGTPYEKAVTTVMYVNDADGTVISQSDSKSMQTFSN